MTVFKKTICVVLAAAIAVSFCACGNHSGSGSIFEGFGGQTASATKQPGPAATEPMPTEPMPTEPNVTDDPDNTPAPTDTPPQPMSDADEAFRQLDLELFASMVTSSSDTYNQCITSDPERFGIDPAEVEKGWGDYYTMEGHIEGIDGAREVLGLLDDIDREQLSDSNKYAYDAIRRCYEMSLMFEDYYYYDEPLTPMNGLHTALPLTMVCIAIRTQEDVETYVYLLEDMPRIIDQIKDFEAEKAKRGLFMTETALDQVVESCRDFADTGSDCFLISYFDTVADKARELGMSEDKIASFRARSDEAVLNGILPAYQRLADTLESNRSKCSVFKGAAERGTAYKEYFDLSVQQEAGTLEDIDVLIDMLEEMGDYMLTEMIIAMYADPDALDRYGEPVSFGSVDQDMDWLAEFTKKYYPEMPEHGVEYVIIPEDIAEDFSPAAYLTPSFDDYYDNIILLNPTSDDTTQLLTLAHEGAPGHMYQFLYFRNTPGRSLTQQLIEPTGCAEGWTVFTEYFVSHNCDDIGSEYCTMMNAESVYGNIFLPAYISLQVNHNGWTVDDVEDYLSEMGMGEYADLFYEYSITMPTYAMSYAIGFAYMLELYNEQSPTTASQHKSYFEKILSYGPTYLDLLVDYFEE